MKRVILKDQRCACGEVIAVRAEDFRDDKPGIFPDGYFETKCPNRHNVEIGASTTRFFAEDIEVEVKPSK